MNEPIEYPYRPQSGGVILGLFVFGGIAFALGRMAVTNDHGLIINGIIHLGVTGANIFYWIFAVMAGGNAALCVLGLASLRMGKRGGVLRLTETALEIPQGLSKKINTVPFSDMGQMKLHVINGQRFLVIQYGQKKVQISQSALPDNAAWEQVCKIIVERTKKAAR